MLRSKFIVLLFCMFTATQSKAKNQPSLDERIIQAGIGAGMLVTIPPATLAAAALSLPAASIAMVSGPIYLLVRGETEEAKQAVYLYPVSIITGLSLSGALFGAITGIVYGGVISFIPASAVRLLLPKGNSDTSASDKPSEENSSAA